MTDQIFLTHPSLDFSDLGCDGIKHGFFTRHGGVSHGLYNSLNGGLGSKDDLDCVNQNRRIAASALGGGHDTICGLYQIHSNIAHRVDQSTKTRAEGDAIVTTDSQVTCLILTADCVPILLADPFNKVIAAAHAGWRGAVEGIVRSTIDLMLDSGAERQHIHAVTGPSIQQSSYQISGDFRDTVLAASPEAEIYFQTDGENHWKFDLPAYVIHQLKTEDVSAVAMPEDTYSDDRFFSHRQATHQKQPDSGRLMSMIRIENNQTSSD